MSLFAVIYLDNNATTRVLPEILEAMLPFYTELWGNPSSLHQFGAQVAPHLDKAREQVAKLIEAQRANEITFTRTVYSLAPALSKHRKPNAKLLIASKAFSYF